MSANLDGVETLVSNPQVGLDNVTTAAELTFDGSKMLESENRIVGVNVNPYLMLNNYEATLCMKELIAEGVEVNKEFGPIVEYTQCISCGKSDADLTIIKYDDVDRHDFASYPFMEWIRGVEADSRSTQYVHFFCDFDKIADESELQDVFNWINSLSSVFGLYTYAGYTNNESIAENYMLRYCKGAEKFVSIHVVYYETMISLRELMMIAQVDADKKFTTEGFHQLCDPAVYELKSGRKFRHSLSAKIYKPGDHKHNKYYSADEIVDGTPSQHLVTVRGNERIIRKAQWSTIFKIPESQVKKNEKQDVEARIPCYVSKTESLEVNNTLIDLNEDQILELFNEFEPEFRNLMIIMNAVNKSPFEYDFIVDLVNRWYYQRPHTNEMTVESFSQYYEREDTNRWFFSIIKHLDPEKRRKWLGVVKNMAIDENITIDIREPFAWYDFINKDYRNEEGEGFRRIELVNDLKRVLVIIDQTVPIFKVKEYDNISFEPSDDGKGHNGVEHIVVKSYSLKDFRTVAEYKIVGTRLVEGVVKNVNLWSFLMTGNNKKYFSKKNEKFYALGRPDYYSIFQGYEWEDKEADVDYIKPYIDHIKEVICKNDSVRYNYLLNWMAYIVQNHIEKTTVALVLIGGHGSGKTVFCEAFANIFGVYADSNVSRLESLVGNYNSAIVNKKLIVCNELQSAENSRSNFDTLKSLITDRREKCREKYVREQTVDNVCNFIFVSNHSVPLKIEEGDRRYFVLEVSDEHCCDHVYFKPIYDIIDTVRFKTALYNYLRTRDLNGWNRLAIPVTQEKVEVQRASENSVVSFIRDNLDEFAKGMRKSKSLYGKYAEYAKDHGFSCMNASNFNANIRRMCKDTTKDGTHVWKLLDKYVKAYKAGEEIYSEEDESVDNDAI